MMQKLRELILNHLSKKGSFIALYSLALKLTLLIQIAKVLQRLPLKMNRDFI